MTGQTTDRSRRSAFTLAVRGRKAYVMSFAALAAFSGPITHVSAQEVAGGPVTETITVVARKQSETLHDVPVNVAVIGAETLERYAINEVADVVARTPGLNVQIGGSGAGAQISLRGIGSTNISAAFDSAVALNFDGVQVSTQRLLQTAFFDIEQIEVLKGPQSLFFGKSASAGVLSLRSANPTDAWEVGGKASYEIEEEGYTLGAYISGPISDTLGIRVALQFQDIAKYVELEAGTPASDRSKELTNFIGRVTFQWDPSDRFSANLKLNYNKQDGDSLLGHSDLSCGPDGLPDPVVLPLANAANGFAPVVIAPSHNCNTKDGLYTAPDGYPGLDVVPTGTTGDGKYRGQAYNDTEIFFARLNWDWELSDALTLSSTSGFVRLDNESLDSFSYTGILADGSPGGLVAPFRNELTQFTQELRVTSRYEGWFNFMVGAFYEDRTIPLSTSQNAFNVSIFRPDPITGFTFDWFAERDSKAQALSVFASATIDLNDKLQLSGGVRYTDETKKTTVAFPYVHSDITNILGFVPSGFFAGPIVFKDDNWSPEVTLRYEVSDDLNVYAAFKTGFKSGGVDNNALPSGPLRKLLDPDPAVRAAVEESLIFDSETSKGGEVGMKARLLDNTVTLNAALFYYVFDNLQVQNFNVAIFNFDTFNASELTTKGIDVDWTWQTPVDGLVLSGAVSYTDTGYSDTFIPAGEDLDGRQAARAPKWSGNVAFDWFTPVGADLEFGLNGNLAFSSSYFADDNTLTDDYRNPSYVTIDAAISIGDVDGSWKLSLIGTNLTDELWVNTSGAAPFRPSVGGDDLVLTQNRGRQISVEAAFKF